MSSVFRFIAFTYTQPQLSIPLSLSSSEPADSERKEQSRASCLATAPERMHSLAGKKVSAAMLLLLIFSVSPFASSPSLHHTLDGNRKHRQDCSIAERGERFPPLSTGSFHGQEFGFFSLFLTKTFDTTKTAQQPV